MEIILGIDNVIFISSLANRFPEEKQKKLIRFGLFLAMFMRIILLMGINGLIKMKSAFLVVDYDWFSSEISIQALILLGGGLFLLYKSTHEIFQKVETKVASEVATQKGTMSFARALLQIVLIDMVFSFDSILTAVGMTNGIPYALPIIIAEAAHLSETQIFGGTIGRIPKGYLYFSIAFSLGVEMINMRFRKIRKN